MSKHTDSGLRSIVVLVIGLVMCGVSIGLWLAQSIGDWWVLLGLVTGLYGALSLGIAVWLVRRLQKEWDREHAK